MVFDKTNVHTVSCNHAQRSGKTVILPTCLNSLYCKQEILHDFENNLPLWKIDIQFNTLTM